MASLDEQMLSLLTEIRDELTEIRELLSDEEEAPVQPSLPNFPGSILPTPRPFSQCGRCGLRLEGMMGHVCSDPSCPTGLGPLSKVGD
ncbi:hypothetical protein RPALISO_46 [Ruegeria phage RpAliso]|nr:hypothetical protein RPALISO_46 [Ruegeria phage RpAliso]